ncbi:MAG: MFS transporter [Acidobacteria bacterium]|nr:MFS transporter [Acidobacteriota bacterium]
MATATAKLTPNQVRGFWAAWGGWALDGMDSFLYALVMVPALRDLLPRSGVPATEANVGYWGGVLFAVFLLGWGCAFLWGPIADRFGRVRTLVLTILCYSLFTFLGCLAASVWQLAAFRFLAGAGIGGEWTIGGVFVAEEWPEARRQQGASWMHTGYYVGTFLAALINYWIGARYGWRAVFAVGGTPALLIAFIRYGVRESARWEHRAAKARTTARAAFFALFGGEYRRRTLVNAALLFVSMVGLWAGSVYVPSSITYLAMRDGAAADAARIASWGAMLLSAGTIAGCLAVPLLASRWGRRGALAFYFALMFVCIAAGFGYVFYLPHGALPWFLGCLLLLGVGGANFAVYTLWLPEQYRTECRASAFAFATSSGRFLAAGVTFLVGAGVARMHTIGTPVAITAIAFLAGLALLPLAEETRGRELPE